MPDAVDPLHDLAWLGQALTEYSNTLSPIMRALFIAEAQARINRVQSAIVPAPTQE